MLTAFEAVHWYSVFPRFDPAKGATVREPLGEGPGWWAGAPSALFDPDSGRIYLYYRYRKPRELGRGVEMRLAVSRNGANFEDVWSCTQAELDTPSVEKGALAITPDGKYRLYFSYVDPADGRWRIDCLEGESFEKLDLSSRRPQLSADSIGAEGVKDPWVCYVAGKYYMFTSYAPTPGPVDERTKQEMHATGDVYNTGIVKSHSGLATSTDGLNWQWEGDVLSPSEKGWDSYCARLGSLIYEPPGFIGFYDGSASVEENYEEKAGLAYSFDLRHWEKLTPEGPFVTSPYASRSIRYVEALKLPDSYFFYYEYARPDGSHELRVNLVTFADEHAQDD